MGQLTLTVVVYAVVLVIGFGFAAWYFLAPSKEYRFEAVGTVTWVGDGDTIGINITEVLVPHEGISKGNDVIRFAGIDTEEIELNSHAISNHPELSGMTETEYEQTDYYAHAVTAKELVENLCPVGGEVYLDIDDLAHNSHPYRGKYDRIIAVIYVENNGTWINVNARVLRQEYPDYCKITSWFASEFHPQDWLGEGYQYA